MTTEEFNNFTFWWSVNSTLLLIVALTVAGYLYIKLRNVIQKLDIREIQKEESVKENIIPISHTVTKVPRVVRIKDRNLLKKTKSVTPYQ